MFQVHPYNEDVTVTDVEPVFQKLISRLDGQKLGCVAILMETFYREYYENNCRQKFLECAKLHGCEKVEIIDFYSMLYGNFLSQAKIVPKNGDVIWIFRDDVSFIWQKINGKGKFVGDFLWYNEFSAKMLDDMRHSSSQIDKDPDIILYLEMREFNEKIVKDVFPNSLVISCRSEDVFIGTLKKARIMSGEADLVGMEAETVLEQDITVKMGDKVIMVIKGLQSLPITQRAEINRTENETDLQVSF
uniref:Uncharacterized protein n=1 Tax=Panagrolaimus davidi TaxID=227884 RepID=A0A914PUS3_9BILA